LRLDEARTEVMLRKQRLASGGGEVAEPALRTVEVVGRCALKRPAAAALSVGLGAAIARFFPLGRIVGVAVPIAVRLLAERGGVVGPGQQRGVTAGDGAATVSA